MRAPVTTVVAFSAAAILAVVAVPVAVLVVVQVVVVVLLLLLPPPPLLLLLPSLPAATDTDDVHPTAMRTPHPPLPLTSTTLSTRRQPRLLLQVALALDIEDVPKGPWPHPRMPRIELRETSCHVEPVREGMLQHKWSCIDWASEYSSCTVCYCTQAPQVWFNSTKSSCNLAGPWGLACSNQVGARVQLCALP